MHAACGNLHNCQRTHVTCADAAAAAAVAASVIATRQLLEEANAAFI